MPRAANPRLTRLERRRAATEDWPRGMRMELRLIVARCAEIREAGIIAGIDPAVLPSSQWAEELLKTVGETPELEAQDTAAVRAANAEWLASHPDAEAKYLAAREARGRQRYGDGSTPDPEAPLGQWHNWARMVLGSHAAAPQQAA